MKAKDIKEIIYRAIERKAFENFKGQPVLTGKENFQKATSEVYKMLRQLFFIK